MLHLSGRVGIGGDVGDLLQLQCAFEGHRQADVPAQVQEEVRSVVAFRDLLDRRAAALEQLSDRVREPPELRHLGRQLLRRQGSAQLRQPQCEQVHHYQLGDERLRGRDTDLESRAGV